MGVVDDPNTVPRFAFHPFSRVKGRYIPPIFFSWISEKKKKKKKKSFDQLQSTLKKIQQRYVHVGGNRLRLYDEVIPTLSALHVSPTVSLFNFFFSPLIISVPEIDSQAASSSFFFPCFFFLFRSRINFDGRFDWKTFHAHLSEYEAGEGRNTNTSSVHVLLSCKAHFYGRAFINGTDICSAIDILVGPA